MFRIVGLFLGSVFLSFLLTGQTTNTSILPEKKTSLHFHFKAHSYQKYGFDALEHKEWKKEYQPFFLNGQIPLYASYKSVNYKEKDRVLLVVKGAKKINKSNLKLVIRDQNVSFSKLDDSTFTIELPSKDSDYILKVLWKNQVVSKLFVQVHKEIREKIVLVPLVDVRFSEREIEQKINEIYQQASIQFDVTLANKFESTVFEPSTVFSTPLENHSQYTGQMKLLRDLYFEKHPKLDRNSFFVFIVNGFADSLLTGFMVKNKSIGFFKNTDSLHLFTTQLAKMLAVGVGALENSWDKKGPEKGTTTNLMDTTNGVQLTHFQWEKLRKLPNYYSYYDNEENVKTNNGTVAYYFWEENKKGNVVVRGNNVLNAFKRPYKYNFLAYRFKVKYFILRPFYKIGNYFVSILDCVFLLGIILILLYIRRKLKQFWKSKKYRYSIGRRFIFVLLVSFVAYEAYENYWVTNRILYYFKQISGPLKELDTMTYSKAKREVLKNQKLLHQEVATVCSEILIKRKKYWYIKKRANVLYFNVKLKPDKGIEKVRFVSSSDSINLNTLNYHVKSTGHYMVFNFINSNDSLEKQEVYNHNGVEISSKLKNENPPKRILVFVNGYRPTSIGRTFEENFSDVQNNGLEYANSQNLIYDFDRFDYWKPWKEINLLFQKRLNPNETYYADGHFSVATSNYRSLFNFTSISTMYPKRCSNPKKHTCHKIQNATVKQFIFNQSKTINQLKMSPNRKGFNLRKSKGRIAGRNLLQIINEIPDFSKNDTVYVVAHSMGFAYSQGIIEELRGYINFGGYYVIAPENPKVGKINFNEWKEVWQYGSNFDQKKCDAPCLQDGIAPQFTVPGIPSNHRVFIPENLYRCKGYFDSHFIGYYTWIFDIKKNQPGYVSKK